jgi:hypothetical protein
MKDPMVALPLSPILSHPLSLSLSLFLSLSLSYESFSAGEGVDVSPLHFDTRDGRSVREREISNRETIAVLASLRERERDKAREKETRCERDRVRLIYTSA